MADVFLPSKRSQVMAAIRSHGNKDTELAMIGIFRRNGVSGWRRRSPLPGRPDFVFESLRIAVFVDGCFWHGCRKHSRTPKSNVEYWETKLARNKKRDREVKISLETRGWHVVRLWEHDLKNEPRALRKILGSNYPLRQITVKTKSRRNAK